MNRYITGLLLLAFAAHSFSEDTVFYCTSEKFSKLSSFEGKFYADSSGPTAKFKVKFNEAASTLELDGNVGDATRSSFSLSCDVCLRESDIFIGTGSAILSIANGQFYYGNAFPGAALALAGNCTKF